MVGLVWFTTQQGEITNLNIAILLNVHKYCIITPQPLYEYLTKSLQYKHFSS